MIEEEAEVDATQLDRNRDGGVDSLDAVQVHRDPCCEFLK